MLVRACRHPKIRKVFKTSACRRFQYIRVCTIRKIKLDLKVRKVFKTSACRRFHNLVLSIRFHFRTNLLQKTIYSKTVCAGAQNDTQNTIQKDSYKTCESFFATVTRFLRPSRFGNLSPSRRAKKTHRVLVFFSWKRTPRCS